MRSTAAAILAPMAHSAERVAPASAARRVLGHRADIDGLRAVAVIPVLLFHAGFSAFSGGFVGVDVFFVISGYLITSIIVDDLDAGRFSLLTFYERRARRIFPALFAMLLASLVIGGFILLPDDLKDLGQSATAAALSAANVLFWHETGYFDVEGAHKPLLHTWSLAVEEQFYIVFPLMLLLLLRADKSRIRVAVPLLFLSLGLAIWSVRTAPAAAFYLVPGRAWELLLGAVLAMGAVPLPGRQIVRDGLSLLGLALIGWSVLALSPATPFPGAGALPPCLGAALIIHAGVGGRSLAGRLLSTRPVVLVGLISYSLYLWHWPLLVFAQSYLARKLTAVEALSVLLLAVAVALASWRWIERPFRGQQPILTRPRLFAAGASAVAATAVLGLGLHLTRGLPDRLPLVVATLAAGAHDRTPDRGRCLRPPLDAVRDGRLCRIGAGAQLRPSFILWGDSHAEMLRSAFGAATRTGRSGVFAGFPGCPPLLGVGIHSPDIRAGHKCRAFNDAVLELSLRAEVETVILAAHWSLYATGVPYGQEGNDPLIRLLDDQGESSASGSEAVARRGLERTVAALVGAGKKVVIVGPVPEVGSSVPWTLALAAWHGWTRDIRPARAAFELRNRAVLSQLASLSERGLAEIVYPHAVLCDEAQCRVEGEGRTFYSDDNHLSRHGADAIRPILEGML